LLLGTQFRAKRFRGIDAKIGNMKTVVCRIKNQWQKIGIRFLKK
jgi:hypothetical protein